MGSLELLGTRAEAKTCQDRVAKPARRDLARAVIAFGSHLRGPELQRFSPAPRTVQLVPALIGRLSEFELHFSGLEYLFRKANLARGGAASSSLLTLHSLQPATRWLVLFRSILLGDREENETKLRHCSKQWVNFTFSFTRTPAS